MAEKTSKDKDSFQEEDFTTYSCPHCGEPCAVGILLHLKVICSYCNKFFVMVGLGQAENP